MHSLSLLLSLSLSLLQSIHHHVPDQKGIQLDHRAHDKMTRRKPRASAKDKKITALQTCKPTSILQKATYCESRSTWSFFTSCVRCTDSQRDSRWFGSFSFALGGGVLKAPRHFGKRGCVGKGGKGLLHPPRAHPALRFFFLSPLAHTRTYAHTHCSLGRICVFCFRMPHAGFIVTTLLAHAGLDLPGA